MPAFESGELERRPLPITSDSFIFYDTQPRSIYSAFLPVCLQYFIDFQFVCGVVSEALFLFAYTNAHATQYPNQAFKLTGSTNSFCSKLPPPRDQSLDDYSFSESAVHHYASLTAGCCIPSLTGLILTSTHPLTHSITRNGSLQHNRHPNSHHPNHLQNHNPLLRLPLLRQIILSRNHPDHRGTELSKRCSGIHAKSCRKNS